MTENKPDAPDNVVSIHAAAPSARFKAQDPADKRTTCEHKAVVIWRTEPVMECKACGIEVDPYWWLRRRIRDWDQWHAAEEYRCEALKQERAVLEKQIRALRGEYRDEIERRAAERDAERAIAVLPPQTQRRSGR